MNYRKAIRNSYSIVNLNQVSYMIFYVTNRYNFCFYSAEIEKGLKANEMSVEEIRIFFTSNFPGIKNLLSMKYLMARYQY